MSILLGLMLAANAAPTEPAKAVAKGDRIVCKRLDTTLTGTNFKQWEKICKKKSVWAAESDAMYESVRRLRDQASGNAGEGLNYCAPGAAC
jgi:hypothetical protein